MNNINSIGEMTFAGTMTVTDNWFAISTAGGRLLAVGTWLPPDCRGIVARQISHEDAAKLLADLDRRTRERGPVGVVTLTNQG